MRNFVKHFSILTTLDPRSLASFRIGTGLIILFDLIIRWQNLSAHYTDLGVLNTIDLRETGLLWGSYSLHALSGSLAYENFLFAIHFIFAALYTLGKWTRVSQVVVWLLLISLHNRNILVVQGGDVLLRVCLFFALFLPLSRVWSLDALQKKRSVLKPIQNWASLCFILQVILIYTVAGIVKTGPEWREKFTAVLVVAQLGPFASDLGKVLMAFPLLSKFLTIATLVIETFGPLLFLVPWRFQAMRMIAVVLFIGLHLGFRSVLDVGPFTWVAMTSLVALLPSAFWDLFKKTRMKMGAAKFENPPTLPQMVACAAMFFVLWLNLSVVHAIPQIPHRALSILQAVRLDQYWDMFSPSPYRINGWFVFPAKTQSGIELDAFSKKIPVSYDRPVTHDDYYPDERWRKLLTNLAREDHAVFRRLMTRYLCEDWNIRRAERDKLEHVGMVFMSEPIDEDGHKEALQKMKLYEQPCY